MRLDRYASRMFGNRIFSSRSTTIVSSASRRAYAGHPSVGCASASLTQATDTCAADTFAFARRLSSVVQHGQLALLHAAPVWPPCAPSITVSRGSRCTSALAIGTNALNSCVVFDIPIDTNTYRPEL